MIIRVKNLRLRAIIGVNPWERTEKQSVIINAEIEFDGSAAQTSDDINSTIDYRSISKNLTDHVENSQYQLIETLAGNLLDLIMEEPRVKRARVEVDKPNAIKSADSTSVEVSAVRCSDGASFGTGGREPAEVVENAYDRIYRTSSDGIGRLSGVTSGDTGANRPG
jgi:D-erythro-7,8-dihydroneopterin triphosphate epimerase